MWIQAKRPTPTVQLHCFEGRREFGVSLHKTDDDRAVTSPTAGQRPPSLHWDVLCDKNQTGSCGTLEAHHPENSSVWPRHARLRGRPAYTFFASARRKRTRGWTHAHVCALRCEGSKPRAYADWAVMTKRNTFVLVKKKSLYQQNTSF